MADQWDGVINLNNSGALIQAIAPNTNAQTFAVGAFRLPGTIWIKPAGGTWTVDYSVDNGVTFASLVGLTGASARTEMQVTSGFTHLRITSSSTAGGTWGIA